MDLARLVRSSRLSCGSRETAVRVPSVRGAAGGGASGWHPQEAAFFERGPR